MEDEGLIARNVRPRMAIMGLGPKAMSLKASLNETYVRDLLKGRSRNPRKRAYGILRRPWIAKSPT